MTIPADQLYLPGHDYVDRVMVDNNRPPAVLRNMQTLYNTGRLGGTGYLYSAGGRGVEHSAGASFAANPLYFDPKNIVELAIEAGCNCSLHLRRAGFGFASLCPPHSVPREAESQRNSQLPHRV